MKKYQNWGFVYLAGKKGINILTGNREDCEDEVDVMCFDGIGFIQVKSKCYSITYPRMSQLTSAQKQEIENYCGYMPECGEYGVVCGALGVAKEISMGQYAELLKEATQ